MSKLDQKLTFLTDLNERDSHNRSLALYKCECGNETKQVKYLVSTNTKKTCGCHRQYRKKPLTEGKIEGIDYVVVKHKSGNGAYQDVLKFKKHCPSCNKDCGFAFKSALDLHCSKCSALKRSPLDPSKIADNYYAERALFKLKDREIVTRSTYETFYIEYLLKNQIKFSYEPEKFQFKDGTSYFPDFYLHDTSEYVELKGRMRDSDQAKIDKFKLEFPEKSIKVLRHSDLASLGYRPSLYRKNVEFSMAGVWWRFKLLSDRDYLKEHGPDSAGMTLLNKKEVHIRESCLSLEVLRHEIFHVMFDSCNTYSASLSPDQVEEVCCDIYGRYADEMLWKSLVIFKVFYVSLANRKRDYIKKMSCYTEYKKEVIPQINKIVKIIKDAKIKKIRPSEIDPEVYASIVELDTKKTSKKRKHVLK